MEEKHPIESLMITSMTSIESMVDVNTIIGESIVAPDGSVIIPFIFIYIILSTKKKKKKKKDIALLLTLQ